MNEIIKDLNSFIDKFNCKLCTSNNKVFLEIESNMNISSIKPIEKLLKKEEGIYSNSDFRYLNINSNEQIINKKITINLSKIKLRQNNIFCIDTIENYILEELKNNYVNFDKARYIAFPAEAILNFTETTNDEIEMIENKYQIYKYIYSLADIKDNINSYFIMEKPVKINDICITTECLLNSTINTNIDDIKKYFSENFHEKKACFKKALIETTNKYQSDKITNNIVMNEFDYIFKETDRIFNCFINSHSADKLSLEIKKISFEIINSIKGVNESFNSVIIAFAANVLVIMNFKFELEKASQNRIIIFALLGITILETFICINTLLSLKSMIGTIKSTKQNLEKRFEKEMKKKQKDINKYIININFLIIQFFLALIGIWAIFIYIYSTIF